MMFQNKKSGHHSLWSYVPHIIRHDFPRKLTQLVLTGMTFIAYHYLQNPQNQSTSELHFDNVNVELELEKGLCNISGKKPTCKITVKGKSGTLSKLSGRNFVVRKKVTLSDYDYWKKSKVPSMKLVIHKSDIRVVEGRFSMDIDNKDLTELSAEEVEVLLDTESTKTLYDINPVFEQSPEFPSNFRVKVTPVLLPGETFPGITISGPSSKIETYGKLQTECFKISNSVSYDTTVKLEKLNDEMKYVGEDSVRLHVEITPPAPRSFEDVPLQILMSPDLLKKGHSITTNPEFVRVKISGHEKVSSVRKEHLHPYVNVQEFTPGAKYKIQCWCDENDIQILDIVPDTTMVSLIPDNKTTVESSDVKKE